MSAWVAEWRMDEWMNGITVEWRKMDKWMSAWVAEWRIDEWMIDAWMDDWCMNGWLK